ncbi:MAG: alpha-acetolactate decarboxylase [Crocinitomicaceae bacterium]|jgi:alpha-acetolactate decarboxylase
MKSIILLIVIGTSVSCSTESTPSEEPSFIVKYEGALKNMMHKGDLSAKADLSDLKNIDHLYALGAIENLKGEIQIFDGKPFNTHVTDSLLDFDYSFNKKASLIVYASVDKWKSIAIPDSIKSYEQLELYIEKSAKENHVNSEKPFPFLLEGTPESFDWHVINWKDGDTEHTHEKHISSGLSGTIINRKVQMLGFYSNSHHTIFTHHTTNMHIHVKTDDSKIAGHVDGFTLGKGMILKLPESH